MFTLRRSLPCVGLLLVLTANSFAGSRLIYPRAPVAADNYTGIAVLNPGASSARLTIKAFKQDGTLLAGEGISNPVVIDLPAGQQVAKLASEVFNPASTGESGYLWIEVTSPADGLTGFFIEGSADGISLDGSNLVAAGTDLSLPLVEKEMELSVVNGESVAGKVVLDFTRADGTIAATRIAAIPANGALQGPLTGLFDVSLDDVASLRLRSDQPVVAYGFYPGNDLAILAAQDATVAGKTLYVPQVLQGGNWATSLGFINLSGSQSILTLTAFDGDGNLLSAPVVSVNPVTQTVAAGGQWRSSLKALFGLSDTAQLDGWIRVESSGDRILGFVDLQTQGGRSLSAARSVGQNQLVFSHQASQPPFYTELSVLNTGKLTTNIEVVSLAPGGQVIGKNQSVLKPGRRFVQTLAELIPLAGGTMGGSVVLRSDQPVMAAAFFGSTVTGSVAGIAPQDIPSGFDPGASLPRISVVPPLSVVETGKSQKFTALGANILRGR